MGGWKKKHVLQTRHGREGMETIRTVSVASRHGGSPARDRVHPSDAPLAWGLGLRGPGGPARWTERCSVHNNRSHQHMHQRPPRPASAGWLLTRYLHADRLGPEEVALPCPAPCLQAARCVICPSRRGGGVPGPAPAWPSSERQACCVHLHSRGPRGLEPKQCAPGGLAVSAQKQSVGGAKRVHWNRVSAAFALLVSVVGSALINFETDTDLRKIVRGRRRCVPRHGR